MPTPTQDRFHLPRPFPPSSDRSFGPVFTGIFLLIATWPLWRGNPVRGGSLGVSAAFLLAALLVPAILRPLNILWARMAEC